MVVDNRPGASGLVGTDLVGDAAPDGYTLLMFTDSNTIAPALYQRVNHDPAKDFEPVAQLATGALVIFAHPSAAIDSLKSLVSTAKARPDALAYASPGNGSAQHLAMERLKLAAGIKVLHVPYKGGGQAMADVIGGQVPLGIAGLAAALPHLRAGKLVPVAVTSAARSPLLPQTPTVAESGLDGFEAVQWFGIVAPARTPAAIVARLREAFVKALATADVAVRLKDLGLELSPGRSAADFAAFIREDAARWPPVVKAIGLKLD